MPQDKEFDLKNYIYKELIQILRGSIALYFAKHAEDENDRSEMLTRNLFALGSDTSERRKS